MIGDEPANTDNDQAPSEAAVSQGEGELLTVLNAACGRLLLVCLAVKPVGEPSAEIGTSGLMSGDGKRSVAKWPKLPRPSSTLPKRPIRDVRCCAAIEVKADLARTCQNRRE